MPFKALRVTGYVAAEELAERMARAGDAADVEVKHYKRMIRLALPEDVLRDVEAERIARLVVDVIGANEAPARQMIVQPNADRREISISLFDVKDRPSFVMPSEPVSVAESVLAFLRSEVIRP